MLLHLTTLLQSMLMPHTLANNDIQTSAISYLSLLKIHSKFRINSRFKGKIFQFSVILYQQNIADILPLLISTDFLKYPFRHLFQTGIKFQL